MTLISPYNGLPEYAPLFFTATIYKWQYLLRKDSYKDVIISSLGHLTMRKQILVYGFVIMPNHIHMILKINEPYLLKNVQRDFLKFTGQVMKLDMLKSDNPELQLYKSTQADREYQIWERRPLSTPLYTNDILEQKLNYIHNNPIQPKWKLSTSPAQYYYSSARVYENGTNDFGFLVHFRS